MDRWSDQKVTDTPFSVLRVAAPVRQQVEDGLRAMIAEGRLSPGERLVERDLCERLGVSRPVLREAFRQLFAEGLLTNLPNRGTAVSELTVEEARETYVVRAQLEGMAAESFARTASDADIAQLRERTLAVTESQAAGDALGLRLAKNAFYDTLVGGCGNSVLTQMLRILHNRIQLLRTVMLSNPQRAAAAAAEISEIFEAIERRDSGRAGALAARHVANGQRAMEAAFAALEVQARDDNGRPTRSVGASS